LEIRFFTWLVCVDRLNTETMLTRRHINVHDDELCVMCETGGLETINHLFFDCTFARQCWSIILFHWDMSLGIEDRFLKAIREHVIPFF
jgi:hypothetical protein